MSTKRESEFASPGREKQVEREEAGSVGDEIGCSVILEMPRNAAAVDEGEGKPQKHFPKD